MNILFVCPGLSVGGAETHLIRYANGLVRRGKHVEILVTGGANDLASALSPDVGLTIMGGRLRDPRTWLGVLRIVCDRRPDVLIGWSLYSNFVVAFSSWFCKPTKTIVCELNYPPALRQGKSLLEYSLIRAATRIFFRNVDVITANSDGALEVLQDWVAGAKGVFARIFNPLDFELVDEMSNSTDADDMVCQRGEVLILAVGRLVLSHKGFDTLVKACAELRARQDWRLYIVGEGRDRQALESLISDLNLTDRIHMLGARKNPFPYYRKADIVALPSRHEGFPNVLLEALAMGKATVSCDCMCGPSEMTQDGRYGRLVPVDDVIGFARELRNLIDDPNSRKVIGSEARSYIAERYSEENVFGSLLRLMP